MQNFSYVGIDSSGRTVSGKLLAPTEADLESRLRGMGLWLVEARAEKQAKPATSAGGGGLRLGASRRELINFCVLLSFQLKVGIAMVPALQTASEDCENPRFRLVLEALRKDVEAGSSLHEAMVRHPVFSRQFVSLIEAGEKSGTLPESFNELQRYLEWQDQIIADVRQATIYPAIVFIIVCIFVLVLFTFVVPRFAMLLTQIKVALPLPTRLVFAVSGVVKATWWLWALIFIGGPLGIMIGKRISKEFCVFYDKVKFKLPLFGGLNHMLAVSRFGQNLAVLYRSGVNIVEALKLTEGLVGSVWMATVIEDVGERVKSGSTLSEAIRKHSVFPGLLVRMVVMGEKTGNLDKALENVSSYYNIIVPRKIKKIFSIAEPALILFLVVIVGFVALAIFLPILGLLGNIR